MMTTTVYTKSKCAKVYLYICLSLDEPLQKSHGSASTRRLRTRRKKDMTWSRGKSTLPLLSCSLHLWYAQQSRWCGNLFPFARVAHIDTQPSIPTSISHLSIFSFHLTLHCLAISPCQSLQCPGICFAFDTRSISLAHKSAPHYALSFFGARPSRTSFLPSSEHMSVRSM